MVANDIVRFFRHLFIVRRPDIQQLEVTNIIVKSVPCLFVYWKAKNIYWLSYTTGKRIPVKTKGLLIIQAPLATDKINIVVGNSWYSTKCTILLKTVDIDTGYKDFLLTDIKHPIYPSSMNGGRRIKTDQAKLANINLRTKSTKQKLQCSTPSIRLKMPLFATSKISMTNHTHPVK